LEIKYDDDDDDDDDDYDVSVGQQHYNCIRRDHLKAKLFHQSYLDS